MMVLAWIGQIILFFVLWRIFHWITGKTVGQNVTMVAELVTNLILAVALLIIVDNIQSAWWLMSLIGIIFGIETGLIMSRQR